MKKYYITDQNGNPIPSFIFSKEYTELWRAKRDAHVWNCDPYEKKRKAIIHEVDN